MYAAHMARNYCAKTGDWGNDILLRWKVHFNVSQAKGLITIHMDKVDTPSSGAEMQMDTLKELQ